MNLDELTQKAQEAYADHYYGSGMPADAMRAAVLTVLEAVKAECVPERAFSGGPSAIPDWDAMNDGWNNAINEFERRLDALIGEKGETR